MTLLEKANQSTYNRLVNGDLSIENAVILWTNFEGRATKFGESGKRTFNLALSEEMAEQLDAEGWNIRCKEPRQEGDDPLYLTEVVVNMESQYPPNVVVYSNYRGNKKAVRMTSDTIKELDRIDIDNVDLVIHPYEHNRGEYKYKGYARAIHVTQAVSNDFGGKYADYEF